MTNLTRRSSLGFTILESAIAVLLFGIVAVALTIGMQNAADRLSDQQTYQTAGMLARDKMAGILADRRNPGRGFEYVQSLNYPAQSWSEGSYLGLARSVTIVSLVPGNQSGAYPGQCPLQSAGCKVVIVTVAGSQGEVLASIVTLLVEPLVA